MAHLCMSVFINYVMLSDCHTCDSVNVCLQSATVTLLGPTVPSAVQQQDSAAVNVT